MDCQQPSDEGAPDDGQLGSGEACGAEALTCPLQPRIRTATSATTTARARRTRIQPRYLRGGYGLEGTHLIGARTNDSGGGLGHFIPGTWEIAERFRDHQPSLITQAVEDLNLRV